MTQFGERRVPEARLPVLIYAVVLLTTLGQVAIVPLLPRYADRFDAGAVATGALLAAPSLATLVIAVPAGVLADRAGARTATLAACWLLGAALLGQALAPSFALLLLSRLLFGVAYGCVWTTALAWLAEARGAGRSLGAATTSSGAGLIVGPAFGAVVAHAFGLAAPFIVLAAACAVAALGLVAVDARRRPAGTERVGVGDAVKAVGHQRGVRGGALSIALTGVGSSMVNLLVPLQLHADGVSTQAVGLAFGAASLLYIAVSAAVVRAGTPLVSVRAAGLCVAAVALASLPAVGSASTVAVLGAMLLYTLPRAALATVAYPLGVAGGRLAGLGNGAVIGMLNTVWAGASVVGPLAAGALYQGLGGRWSWAALAVGSLAAAGLLMQDSR